MKENTMNNPSLFLRTWSWLKGFPSRHKIITALAVLFLVWQAIMTPIKNPFANDAITVRGRFPFDQGYELMFSQETYSNPESRFSKIFCKSFAHSFTSCNGGSVRYYPKKIDGQHYELTVYRDAYFSGLLGWVSKDRLYYRVHQKMVDGDKHKGLFYCLGPSPEINACNDTELSIQKYNGGLFCMGQKEHKNYKALTMPTNNADVSNVQEYDFWLYSELDAKLKEIKP